MYCIIAYHVLNLPVVSFMGFLGSSYLVSCKHNESFFYCLEFTFFMNLIFFLYFICYNGYR